MSRRAHAEAIAELEAMAEQVLVAAVERTMDVVVDKLDHEDLAAQAGTTGLTASAVDGLSQVLTAWGAEVDKNVLPFYRKVFEAGGYAALAQVVDGDELAAAAQPAARALSEPAARHLAQSKDRFMRLGDQVWSQARGVMLDGIEQGKAPLAMVEDLRGVADLSRRDAAAVARTEMVSAGNAGAMAQMRSMDEGDRPKYKQWLATLDDRTRDSHLEADGQVVPVDEPFLVGGSPMDYPGDPGGPPEETINCRCTQLFTENPEGFDLDAIEGRGGVLEEVADDDLTMTTKRNEAAMMHSNGHNGDASAGTIRRRSPLVAAASGDPTTGGMICLLPADPERLALEGGEPAEELHVTLFFLGDAVDVPTDVLALLIDGVETLSTSLPPIEAEAWAVNWFNPKGEHPAWVLGIGNAGSLLDEAHDGVVALTGSAGWDPPIQHAPWVPHLTIAYSGDNLTDELVARLGPVTFDRIAVFVADDVHEFPLSGVPDLSGTK